MKISIVTDEVSTDPETAMEIIRSWGVDYVEFRGIGDSRYPLVTDYWHYRLPHLLEEFDLKVAALSPGIFQSDFPKPAEPMGHSRRRDIGAVKAALDARAKLDHELRVILPQSIEAAKRFGTDTIICFNFARIDHQASPPATDEMIGIIRQAADIVAAENMQLLVEISEPSARPADMVRRINHPAVGINWDPAAAYSGGEDRPYPDGFNLVRPYVRHVHFKDAWTNPANGKREPTAHGVIDWRNTLRDLVADGFDGFVSVETHFRPKVAGTRSCLDRLRSILDEIQEGAAAA